jgi:hypothetical protein
LMQDGPYGRESKWARNPNSVYQNPVLPTNDAPIAEIALKS